MSNKGEVLSQEVDAYVGGFRLNLKEPDEKKLMAHHRRLLDAFEYELMKARELLGEKVKQQTGQEMNPRHVIVKRKQGRVILEYSLDG